MTLLLALMIFCSSFNSELTVIIPTDTMTDCTVLAYPIDAPDLIINMRETGRSADAVRYSTKITKHQNNNWRIVAYSKGKVATTLIVPYKSQQITLNLINVPAPSVSEVNGKYRITAHSIEENILKTELMVNGKLFSDSVADIDEPISVAYAKYYFSERICISSDYYVSQ